MRTIVTNRLFSVNELNFVFENAIELSPFNRQDMMTMIDELKDELGLSNDLDVDSFSVEEMKEVRELGERQAKNRKKKYKHHSPGGKQYMHGLAGTRE